MMSEMNKNDSIVLVNCNNFAPECLTTVVLAEHCVP